MKNPFILFSTIALASCAPPKAQIIYEVPEGFGETEPAIASTSPQPNAAPTRLPVEAPLPKNSSSDDSGSLRLPNMLALPDEKQLRSTATDDPSPGDATIITRPPTE